ncbi:MAG TPA: serine hydrolase [Acidimicrobiales bacterium]|nr:serine hydrolase [Acidimicrobiales bacterium]
MRAEAADRESAQVAIVRDGEPILDWMADGEARLPIELMSCTKMIVALAAGAALGDEAVELLDVAVAELVPAWTHLPTSVTLANLLAHHTGLVPIPAFEVYRADDIVTQALGLDHDESRVGAHTYNNSAINLVAALVQERRGRPFRDLADEALFSPLGWGDWRWHGDDAGNPYCFAGIEANARDAAMAAALLIDDPKGVLPSGWAEAVINRRLSCYGQVDRFELELTAALRDQWVAAGVDPLIVAALNPLVDQPVEYDRYFESIAALLTTAGIAIEGWMAEIDGAGLPRGERRIGQRIGHGHDGDGGQWLVVFPEQRAAACRLRWITDATDRGGPASWSSFPGAVRGVLA